MSTTPATGEIAEQVTNYPFFHRWNEAASTLERRMEEAPFHDSEDSFDRTNSDHLYAQMQINNAASGEQSYRSLMRQEIASGTDDNLDLLARLSLLHALDRFKPRPKMEVAHVRVFGEDTAVRVPLHLFHSSRYGYLPLPDPSSVTDTLELADTVDDTIRTARSLLYTDKPSKIVVSETRTWSGGLRTMFRGGREIHFKVDVKTKGTLDSDKIAPLCRPTVCTDGAVYYELPDDLPGVAIRSQAVKPTEYSIAENPSSLRKLQLTTGEAVVVPLLAAMLAQGKDVSQFHNPIYGGNGNERLMKITINGTTLDNDPRSYIS